MISGQALYVQMSGVLAQMSGLVISQITSSLSGQYIMVTNSSPLYNVGIGTGNVNTGLIRVGTSGAQFPNQPCAMVVITMGTSNVLWLGGGSAANANSGVGFMWNSTGIDSRQTMVFNINNLNLIYGKAQAVSSVIYYIAT
jgi:hypothetical protein